MGQEPAKRLILIVGLGHSGSTLLDAALGASQDICGLGEALRLSTGVNHDHLTSDEGRRRPCTCGKPVETCPVWSRILPSLGPDMAVDSHFPIFFDSAMAANPGARYVLDSSPGGATYLDSLKHYDVRVIRLTRDVRSWTASRRRRRPGSGITSAYTAWWRGNRELDRALGPTDVPILNVGYEELALRPEATLRLVCDWLDVEFQAEMLFPLANTRSHIITGNGTVRRSPKKVPFRYDAAWMPSTARPIWQATLFRFCQGANERLVYGNGVIRGRSKHGRASSTA